MVNLREIVRTKWINSNHCSHRTRKMTSSMEGPKYPNIGNRTIHTKGVEKHLQKHKINKASSPDDLPAYILRETVTELAPVHTVIFNQSLKTGTLHEHWP